MRQHSSRRWLRRLVPAAIALTILGPVARAAAALPLQLCLLDGVRQPGRADRGAVSDYEVPTDYWRTSVRELAPGVPVGGWVTCSPASDAEGSVPAHLAGGPLQLRHRRDRATGGLRRPAVGHLGGLADQLPGDRDRSLGGRVQLHQAGRRQAMAVLAPRRDGLRGRSATSSCCPSPRTAWTSRAAPAPATCWAAGPSTSRTGASGSATSRPSWASRCRPPAPRDH